MELAEVEAAVAELDAVYRPVANAPVDLERLPQLGEDVAAALSALDVGDRAEAVLGEMVELYAAGDGGTRAAVRELFDRYPSFRWAAQLPYADDVDAVRAELILFSARDQGSDTRDEILGLRDLCDRARRAGVDVDALLAEVAAISSDIDRYGMGSTRSILLGHRDRRIG
ncbi:hypothetical protein Cs7R123_16640 [Catellatospora sp. TT07R-123]|uniref:hypothetical protein n=1 Tax=Catellatospora sp. TT07R-123 TaxID=2733863 RepID=UPI001B1EEE08|nr:hypothetical protein [Catellatospora sp. TT07R-123]GHJ44322.1 hypothetical protein Cs7R123_16640 [Catellatospora sp. TT07R-123]